MYEVKVERQVMVPMRDGTRLAADLYMPEGEGKFPVVVERTPYDREESVFLRTDSARVLASRGYIVAIQDVRGRFGSEGVWYPFVDDGWGKNQDGYDTVEWLAKHPRSNGNVGTAGGSYAGQTQMLLAPTRPPHLKCCFIREPASDLAKQWLYRGGAFELAFNWDWGLRHGLPALFKQIDRLKEALEDKGTTFGRLGMLGAGVLANPMQWLADTLAHPDDDEFYEPFDFERQYKNIGVPILHMVGWFDIFLAGSLRNFSGIVREGRKGKGLDARHPSETTGGSRTRPRPPGRGSQADQHGFAEPNPWHPASRAARPPEEPGARGMQKLLVGPWVHGPMVNDPAFARYVGDLDFGPRAVVDLNAEMLRWFDYWLKGIETGVMDEPAVRYFLMGADVGVSGEAGESRWRTAEEWPPAGTEVQRWYFQGGKSGTAGSVNDGKLAREKPGGGAGAGDGPARGNVAVAGDGPARRKGVARDTRVRGGVDSYRYDPANPVRTIGGNTLYSERSIPGPDGRLVADLQGTAGPRDQRPVEPMCLTYTSDVLERDLDVVGPVSAVLFASSSAVDTDFVAKLCDVCPDGRSILVADGILRGRYRASRERPRLLEPGQVYRFEIDLWATAWRFRAGHRLRVAVTSSNFPRFDRNLNTGRTSAESSETKVAVNRVFRDRAHHSHIVLPVVGGE